jgi:hypothetical protein
VHAAIITKADFRQVRLTKIGSAMTAMVKQAAGNANFSLCNGWHVSCSSFKCYIELTSQEQ